MERVLILGVAGLLMLSLAVPAFATEPKDKLARGVSNVVSSLVEVPQNIDIE